MSEKWRGVVAALLNPDLRAALGELSAGVQLTDARRTRALRRLAELGLVEVDETGQATFSDAALTAMLAENTPPRPTGPERFLDSDGRIDRYPMRMSERRALLVWIVEHTLQPGEVLDERALNERLAQFTADVAVLRRYLVDHDLVERTPSGSQYARVTPAAE
ncbi:DUF2087 domain-containing protein [Microbacterium protaetiae]|uniref:DUF2087 domain-containing protein n=1 Tax=Microbacterium protaetiae TaxID=2509458 RepID=A0A4P6EFN8_9MICO|nr:DUF2087 domain-containing protein [Microbacterium protaetiae]QAY61210.1 DUF2087 domain-containing protein [Microbacterium protaetiae]